MHGNISVMCKVREAYKGGASMNKMVNGIFRGEERFMMCLYGLALPAKLRMI